MPPTLRMTAIAALLTVCAGLLLSSCGDITWGDDPAASSRSAKRRMYVNDRAPNDSLRADLVHRGVKFVLQPNRAYELTLDSTTRTNDKIDLYYYLDNQPRFYKTLKAVSGLNRESFSFASDQSIAQFFLAQLNPGEVGNAVSGLKRVSLANANSLSADTLQLRVLFIRSLRMLPDSAAKAGFAKALFLEMGKIYAPFGIVLQGSVDIVEGAGAKITFPFSNKYVSLPGNRAGNHAHLYLVDSISIADPKSGLAGEVLGFAPREVVDIDNHPESRVVLSARILEGQSLALGARSLAITATHELGHFFGLRHTVSTLHDFLQDDDFSNKEDGFGDTRFCNLDIAVAKRAAASAQSNPQNRGATQYCLRIAGDNSCEAFNGCDIDNLMHPVDCLSRNQTKLTPQQIAFLKTNLASYRH
ncbi:MAG: hypothetical protein ABIW76_08290 [Fibrobacteria bacterium]